MGGYYQIRGRTCHNGRGLFINQILPLEMDKEKVKEVILFAENDYDSYDALIKNYVPALQRKVKAGKYDKAKAPKLLEYYYTNYVRRYMKMPRKYGFDPKLNPQERAAFGKYFADVLHRKYVMPYKKKLARTKKTAAIAKSKRKLKK